MAFRCMLAGVLIKTFNVQKCEYVNNREEPDQDVPSHMPVGQFGL